MPASLKFLLLRAVMPPPARCSCSPSTTPSTLQLVCNRGPFCSSNRRKVACGPHLADLDTEAYSGEGGT